MSAEPGQSGEPARRARMLSGAWTGICVGGVAGLIGGLTSGKGTAITMAVAFAVVTFWIGSRRFWWTMPDGLRHLLLILAVPVALFLSHLLVANLVPR